MSPELSNFKVTNREDFAKFIDLLYNEFNSNTETWSNRNLADFLQALSSYTEDIQGYYDNMELKINADLPDWQTFADILKGATMYE